MIHPATTTHQPSTAPRKSAARGTPDWLIYGLIVVALSLGGCAAWGRPAANDPAPDERQAMPSLRPPGKEGQLLGLDERSREIERSLGVR